MIPSGASLVQVCGLLASAVFEKIKVSHLCSSWTTVGPFEPRFRGQGGKCTMGFTIENEALESLYPKLQMFLKSV